MTPHDLINLPGAGNAEKWLRKNGKWADHPKDIPMGDLENIITELDDAIESASSLASDALSLLRKMQKAQAIRDKNQLTL